MQTLVRCGRYPSPQQAPVLPLSSVRKLSQLLQVTEVCVRVCECECVCAVVSIIDGVGDDKSDTLQLVS